MRAAGIEIAFDPYKQGLTALLCGLPVRAVARNIRLIAQFLTGSRQEALSLSERLPIPRPHTRDMQRRGAVV